MSLCPAPEGSLNPVKVLLTVVYGPAIIISHYPETDPGGSCISSAVPGGKKVPFAFNIFDVDIKAEQRGKRRPQMRKRTRSRLRRGCGGSAEMQKAKKEEQLEAQEEDARPRST